MSSISRRTLAKGAAWSLPAVVAASAVPAMAASNVTPRYGVSASWYSHYNTQVSSTCDYGQGQIVSMVFNTSTDVDEYSHGFAIINQNDTNNEESETTSVTISDFVMRVAFPHGMVKSLAVASGSYTVSGPVAQTVEGVYSDVFAFAFTGTTTGTTQSPATRPTAWPGSPLTTKVTFDTNGCYDDSGTSYFAQWTGTFMTGNGFTGQPPAGWLALTESN